MCGIVGYVGIEDTKEILLQGLERLEYRGYDSAGIAIVNDRGVHMYKEKGRISALRKSVNYHEQAKVGIGHTRWATHGAANRKNAHPHQSKSARFTIVHNGVIENGRQLSRQYLYDVELVSDTDTEIIVQLVEKFALSGLTTEETGSAS